MITLLVRTAALLKQAKAMAAEADAIADELGKQKLRFEAARLRIVANCQRDQIQRLRDVADTLSK